MPDQFNLSIELGNDAMQTNGDIAALLHDLAEQFDRYASEECVSESGTERDSNGNTVARWGIA